MKHKEKLKLMNNNHNEIIKTHTEWQKEYARSTDNVFANFERIANDMHLTREMVLWIYLYKHIDGIKAYIEGHDSQREDVRGRITDAIVYLKILWGMINDNVNKYEEVK